MTAASKFFLCILLTLNVFPLAAQTLYVPGGTVGVSTNGNVGIGTSTPAAALQVTAATGNQGFKVGIGRNAANSNAEVRGTIAAVASDANSASETSAVAWNFYNAGSGPSWSGTMLRYYGTAMPGITFGLPTGNLGALVFQNTLNAVIATNGPAVTIAPLGLINTTFSPNGHVGVGTTTPAARLDVAGGSIIAEQMIYVRHIEGKNWNDQSTIGDLYFQYINNTNNIVFNNGKMFLQGVTGNVGIGTTNPTQKLSVNGTVRAKEIIVETTGWSDYVLAKDYILTPLSEVEQQIEREGRLSGIPSARDVAENGVSLGEMQSRLLAKVEELTLHLIAQDKRLSEATSRIAVLEAENTRLTARR